MQSEYVQGNESYVAENGCPNSARTGILRTYRLLDILPKAIGASAVAYAAVRPSVSCKQPGAAGRKRGK